MDLELDDTHEAEAYTQEPNSLWHNALQHLMKKRSAVVGLAMLAVEQVIGSQLRGQEPGK